VITGFARWPSLWMRTKSVRDGIPMPSPPHHEIAIAEWGRAFALHVRSESSAVAFNGARWYAALSWIPTDAMTLRASRTR
jgi:hypothetical protein